MKPGWQTKILGDVCSFENGDRGENYPSKSVQTTSGVPFINAGHLTEFGLDFETMNYIPRERYNLLGNGKIRENDILFCLRGSLGKFASVGELSEGAIASSLVIVRPKDSVLNAFVSAYFQSDLCASMIEKYKNGAAQPNLSAGSLKNFIIPVPPLHEQQRIVAILDEAFDGIATAKANAEKNLLNARALFESHLQSVFSERGDGWVEKALADLCEIKHGYAFDGADFSSGVSMDRPLVITPGNFTEDGKLLFNEKNSKRLRGNPPPGFLFNMGDLVVVMTDLSSRMKILGKPAFVESGNVLHNQRIGRVVFFNDSIEKRFVYYFMMSEGFLNNIKESATGTMVKHTAPKRILNNLITFPPDKKAQHALINKLDGLKAETKCLESIYQQKLAALDALKKSLLDQAFSGNL